LDEEARGGARTARFELDRRVFGARLVKEITLRDGHPFAYQRHVFHGGEGAISVASHAMTRFDKPGRLSFSAKAFADLPDKQSEPDPTRGRSRFATGVRFMDLGRLPLADGTTADLGRYPIADRHEDFVMLVEAQAAGLGWTAAVRPGAQDIMLSLKNPRDFPVTFLWYSNGGRDYPPWNGRHLGVLGIEEGRAWAGYGHAASIAPNPLSRVGIPTSLTLVPGGSIAVSHVVGGLSLPQGWARVKSVAAGQGTIRLTGDAAGEVVVPFDAGFLAG
jgi:hypothetical protein